MPDRSQPPMDVVSGLVDQLDSQGHLQALLADRREAAMNRSTDRIAALVEQVWPRRVLDLKVGDLLVTFVVSTLRYSNVRAVDVDELAEKLAVPRACIEMTNVQAGIAFQVDLGDVTPIEVPCGRLATSEDTTQPGKPTARTATLELCRDAVDHEGRKLACILEVGHVGQHEDHAAGMTWSYAEPEP